MSLRHELSRFSSTRVASPPNKRMQRTVTGTLLLLTLLALAEIPRAEAQNQSHARAELVLVYRTHFEAGGKRFESADDLRRYLESVSTKYVGVDVRECGAQQRLREATDVISSVANKKVVEAGGKPSAAMQMQIASVPCAQE